MRKSKGVSDIATYTELAFAPATLGGLSIDLDTEKGKFYVFSITENLNEIEFYYAEDGIRENAVKSYEIDLTYGNGTYAELKQHVIDNMRPFGLDKKAAAMFEEWRK